VACFKVLSQHSPIQNKQHHRNLNKISSESPNEIQIWDLMTIIQEMFTPHQISLSFSLGTGLRWGRSVNTVTRDLTTRVQFPTGRGIILFAAESKPTIVSNRFPD